MTQRDKLHSVVGYICPHDSIQSRIVYWDSEDFLHDEIFPEVQFLRKKWRYDPDRGGISDVMSPVDLTPDEVMRIEDHLLKKLNWDELP